jgi:hypothetical protein
VGESDVSDVVHGALQPVVCQILLTHVPLRAAFDPSSGEPSANVADADCGIVNPVENP